MDEPIREMLSYTLHVKTTIVFISDPSACECNIQCDEPRVAALMWGLPTISAPMCVISTATVQQKQPERMWGHLSHKQQRAQIIIILLIIIIFLHFFQNVERNVRRTNTLLPASSPLLWWFTLPTCSPPSSRRSIGYKRRSELLERPKPDLLRCAVPLCAPRLHSRLRLLHGNAGWRATP